MRTWKKFHEFNFIQRFSLKFRILILIQLNTESFKVTKLIPAADIIFLKVLTFTYKFRYD